ncbi:hypothetical protein BDV93DRAFT_28914 [Ceratobasidium sp. AG-I]|nr:hypothetical protein BDV93DRAFT_28914 [Ceratobasidium sp. AG-I]
MHNFERHRARVGPLIILNDFTRSWHTNHPLKLYHRHWPRRLGSRRQPWILPSSRRLFLTLSATGATSPRIFRRRLLLACSRSK